MLVKLGAEHSALRSERKCFDQFSNSCYLMEVKLGAEHSTLM